MLRAERLVKAYRGPSGGAVPVLAGVDLRVGAGELIVVRGASGSGKSTLLNVLGLLEDADAGDVWYGDARVSGLSRSAQSRKRVSGHASTLRKVARKIAFWLRQSKSFGTPG